MAGQEVKARVFQGHGALNQLAQGPDDRVQPLRVQGEVGELPVDLN